MKTNLKLPWRVVKTGGHVTIRDSSTKVGRAILRKAVSKTTAEQYNQIVADFAVVCWSVNRNAETNTLLTDMLSDKLITLMSWGAKMTGTYEPGECLAFGQESMTADEYKTAYEFLTWCHTTNHSWGHGNVQAVYQKFLNRGRSM